MHKREEEIQQFLGKNGWGEAVREKLFSDASFRHYERISNGQTTLMLMDAPPEREDIKPFINIDQYLINAGFSAPQIYAFDKINGFILLEDLGNNSFTNVLEGKSPISGMYSEKELYISAIDALAELHKLPHPSSVPDYNQQLLMRECQLLVDWFLPNIGLEADIKQAAAEYTQIWENLLSNMDYSNKVPVLRDYHADNLMWLPEREGTKKVGMLDFQDAVLGDAAYDIISLLEDARRDVAFETVQLCIDRYLQQSQTKRDNFMLSYAIYAAQRNCKIVGIFARLAIRDHKTKYLSYMPRVWGHLMRDVTHPALASLQKWMEKFIPGEKQKPEAFVVPKVG